MGKPYRHNKLIAYRFDKATDGRLIFLDNVCDQIFDLGEFWRVHVGWG